MDLDSQHFTALADMIAPMLWYRQPRPDDPQAHQHTQQLMQLQQHAAMRSHLPPSSLHFDSVEGERWKMGLAEAHALHVLIPPPQQQQHQHIPTAVQSSSVEEFVQHREEAEDDRRQTRLRSRGERGHKSVSQDKPESPEWQPGNDDDDDAPPHNKSASAAAPGRARRRKRDPSSHTSREPNRGQFASKEEFDRAWARWRELRDSNNDAVWRSRAIRREQRRNNSVCPNTRCARSSAVLQRNIVVLVKGIRDLASLESAERALFDRLVATPQGHEGSVHSSPSPSADAAEDGTRAAATAPATESAPQ